MLGPVHSIENWRRDYPELSQALILYPMGEKNQFEAYLLFPVQVTRGAMDTWKAKSLSLTASLRNPIDIVKAPVVDAWHGSGATRPAPTIGATKSFDIENF